MIDRILRAIPPSNPVSDYQRLFIGGWKYQRMALKSITAPQEDVDYVNFYVRFALQVQYRSGEAISAK